MILTRDENESKEHFAQRLIEAKNSLGCTWNELGEIINKECGWNYGPDTYRMRSYKLPKISKEIMSNDVYQSLDDQLLQIRKEKIKLAEERTQINALVRNSARDELLKEIALEVSKNMNAKMLLEPVTIESSGDKNGILIISDWHYGVDEANIFNTYNPDIAKDRINKLLEKTIKYIEDEKIKSLAILNLGDLIAGNIHLPLRINSRYDVITQIMNVSELLAQFISELASHTEIIYGSVLDNHSRIDPNKKDALPLESLARITDWYLKERLKDFKVEWLDNAFGLDIIAFEFDGLRVAAVHGDVDKPNRVIDNLTSFTQNHFDLICSAHLHHFSSDESNNTLLVSNGSLMGTDDYARRLRLNSNPSQTLLIIDNIKVEKIIKIDLD